LLHYLSAAYDPQYWALHITDPLQFFVAQKAVSTRFEMSGNHLFAVTFTILKTFSFSNTLQLLQNDE
jgi:hypothetical protein